MKYIYIKKLYNLVILIVNVSLIDQPYVFALNFKHEYNLFHLLYFFLYISI